MAIDKETAAMVAAQLTTAWAMRVGIVSQAVSEAGKEDCAGEVVQMYEVFRKIVGETDSDRIRRMGQM